MPSSEPIEAVADVMARLGSSGAQLCVIVNEHRVLQGRLRLDRLDPTDAHPAEKTMEPGPTTIRADADLADTTEGMRQRGVAALIVSDRTVSCSASYTPSPAIRSGGERDRTIATLRTPGCAFPSPAPGVLSATALSRRT